jgi:predicted nucleic acid-binding Zn ribbon protein
MSDKQRRFFVIIMMIVLALLAVTVWLILSLWPDG